MALIICPECKKPDISSTAEHCPYCGYGIKEHFELERRRQENAQLIAEQEQRRAEQERKKQNAREELKPELERKLKEIDDMSYPEKPSFLKIVLNNTVLGGIGVALVFYFLIWIWEFTNWFVILCFLASILWIIFFLLCNISIYKTEVEFRERTISDWENYKNKKRKEVCDTYENYADNIARYGYRNAPSSSYSYTPKATNIPKCPVCGSTKIKKLSTMKKMGSVYVAGLASDSIGKQMQCESCGYKF